MTDITVSSTSPHVDELRESHCSYCMTSHAEIQNPRCLLCGHTFCLECLKSDLELNNAVTCRLCQKKYYAWVDLINDLVNTRELRGSFCHPCSRKGKTTLAVSHCFKCEPKLLLCIEHLLVSDCHRSTGNSINLCFKFYSSVYRKTSVFAISAF